MSSEPLSLQAKSTLLKVARNTLKKHFNPRLPPLDTSLQELMKQNGAFVTLHKNHALRGCIGVFTSDDPLYKTVASMTMAAAFDDPRFPPLSLRELDRIEIEISVLSPLERVVDLKEIELGTHGIYIKKGFSRGVLLPQVATEYAWDRETFLTQTCRKANLPGDCWQKGAEIYRFSADIFKEN